MLIATVTWNYWSNTHGIRAQKESLTFNQVKSPPLSTECIHLHGH